ncbi:PREDICTED: defensin-like protein 301 [Camelina sativa]|uniref:Defensin-like protein 301 n=1 Tax=Camelina sativa TaxID=90675 RepID=A0ABM0XTP7_CAMSA|nr:PREDICTED: defensin-like protein 301 [Camelina sativa]
MEKVRSIFVVLLLISSCLIMRSEGQFRCKSARDCDPRAWKLATHIICDKNHKCTCADGAPIGHECNSIKDCYLSAGCPPNSHVVCERHICTCVPKLI